MHDLRNLLNETSSLIKSLSELNVHLVLPAVHCVKGNRASTKQILEQIDWVLEIPDELDVLIAERKFEEAVQMVEKWRALLRGDGEKTEIGAAKAMRSELEERIERLVGKVRFVGGLVELSQGGVVDRRFEKSYVS